MSRFRHPPVVGRVFYFPILLLILLAAIEGQSQTPAPAAPVPAPQAAAAQAAAAQAAAAQAAAAQAAAAQASPEIDSVQVYSGPSVADKNGNLEGTFILEIIGKNFNAITDFSKVRVIPFPSTGVTSMSVVSGSSDGTKIIAQFIGTPNYVLQQVAVSVSDSNFLTFDTKSASCDFKSKVRVTPQVMPIGQSRTNYGDGIGTNFYVVEFNVVNGCSMPIDIPLAGISIVANGSQNDSKSCALNAKTSNLVPFPLEHLTSIYTEDRKLTGHRAKYFNSLLAIATLGSAIEPFFGHGFTQGVAILGGAFTTASGQIFVDMSAQQLQNITSQSFGSIQQVAAGGSVQKAIFVARIPNCVKKHKDDDVSLEKSITSSDFRVSYALVPASAQLQTGSALAVPVVPAQ
jgi:hypothetical protein